MAEAYALAGRSAALRLLVKHVENRGAALVHQAEDLALEVQRQRLIEPCRKSPEDCPCAK